MRGARIKSTVVGTDGGGSRLRVELPHGVKTLDYQIEMIERNNINGLLPFSHIVENGRHFLYYDAGGMTAVAKSDFGPEMNVCQAARILLDVARIAARMDKYLLSVSCLVMDYCYVYVDAEEGSVGLLYVPTDAQAHESTGFSDLVKEILGMTRPSCESEKLYCNKIAEEANNRRFSFNNFCDFLTDMLSFADPGIVYATQERAVEDSQAKVPFAVGGDRARITAGKRDNRRAKNVKCAATSETGRSGNAMLLSALVGGGIVVAYFAALSFIDREQGSIRMAALLLAIGAELFAFVKFLPKGAVTVSAAESDGKGAFGSNEKASKKDRALRSAKTKKTRPCKQKRKDSFEDAVNEASAAREAAIAAQKSSDDGFLDVDLWSQSLSQSQTDYDSLTQETSSALPTVEQPSVLAEQETSEPQIEAHGPVQEQAEALAETEAQAETKAETQTETQAETQTETQAEAEAQGLAEAQDQVQFIETSQRLRPYLLTSSDEETQALFTPRPEIEATLLVRDEMRECGIVFRGGEFVIGRKNELADLALDNRAVGKTHAKIERRGGDWILTDMNSKNGTYVNNIRLGSGLSKPLRNRDIITAANVDMVFSLRLSALPATGGRQESVSCF